MLFLLLFDIFVLFFVRMCLYLKLSLPYCASKSAFDVLYDYFSSLFKKKSIYDFLREIINKKIAHFLFFSFLVVVFDLS